MKVVEHTDNARRSRRRHRTSPSRTSPTRNEATRPSVTARSNRTRSSPHDAEPRARVAAADPEDEIHFKFVGLTDLDSPGTQRTLEVLEVPVRDDSTWICWAGGAEPERRQFPLERRTPVKDEVTGRSISASAVAPLVPLTRHPVGHDRDPAGHASPAGLAASSASTKRSR